MLYATIRGGLSLHLHETRGALIMGGHKLPALRPRE